MRLSLALQFLESTNIDSDANKKIWLGGGGGGDVCKSSYDLVRQCLSEPCLLDRRAITTLVLLSLFMINESFISRCFHYTNKVMSTSQMEQVNKCTDPRIVAILHASPL